MTLTSGKLSISKNPVSQSNQLSKFSKYLFLALLCLEPPADTLTPHTRVTATRGERDELAWARSGLGPQLTSDTHNAGDGDEGGKSAKMYV